MRLMDVRLRALLVSVFFVLGSQTLFAQTVEVTPEPGPAKNCVDAAQMTEFARDFQQFSNLSGKEYCLDGSQTSGLIESLLFMKKTVFDSGMKPSQDQLFSGKFANDWYGYFAKRINEMEVQSNCQKGVGAFVYMWGNTMYVCPMMLTKNFTALDRASVFMHEARHIDGYPHVTCNRGPRMGLQGACDRNIAEGGSYAVSVETYAQIAKYATGLHPALRAYARAAATTYADEAFNTEVKVDRQPKFNLLTYSKDFFELNPAKPTEMKELGSAPELGRIVMRAQFMILFPENKTSNARYLFANNEGEIAQGAGDLATEYNNSPANERDDFVDAHIGAQWVTTVTKTAVRMACDPRSDSTSEVRLNGERAHALIYPNGYERSAKTIQLQMESGKVFDLSCGSGGTPSVRPSGQQFDRVFKKMYRVGSMTLGIDDKGLLYSVQNGVSKSFPNYLDHDIYELAPVATTNFFE